MKKEEMTRKLAEIIFRAAKGGYMPYDTNDEMCAMNIAKKHVDEFSPSLPSNLDEAANEFGADAIKDYYNDIFVTENGVERPVLKSVLKHDFIDAFKTGAEWMAEQGKTCKATRGVFGLCYPGDMDKFLADIEQGESVIIQVRKK